MHMHDALNIRVASDFSVFSKTDSATL